MLVLFPLQRQGLCYNGLLSKMLINSEREKIQLLKEQSVTIIKNIFKGLHVKT